EKAWEKANEMAKQGLFLGISAAANLLAAEEVASRPENSGKNIVTVFPDGGSKYLSLDIYGK
ncbi:MAG: cysteine synthase, partial [Bacilli bacterium]|nr:cysteine synthase [Bacilli bacterium]